MSRTLPTFLVAGAGRSGTTALVEGLRTHPSVFVTEPKEPHYFALHGQAADFRGPGDAATINRVAVTERGRYLDLYPGSQGFCALGDGSVSTLYYYKRAVPEILEMNPETRIVILLREPVDRAYSSYQYMRARGFEPLENFLKSLAAEEDRRREDWHHLWHYTAMSRYADSVGAFLEHIGPAQVGIWYYDDLLSDYVGTVKQVLRFIGAPPIAGEGVGVPRVNSSGMPKWDAGQRVMWLATRNEGIRRTVKRFTSYRLRERLRRVNLRPTGVSAEARAQLAPLFADDLKRLSSLVEPTGQPAWLTARLPAPKVPPTHDGAQPPEQ